MRGIRIHGSRYGVPQAPDEDIEITFLSEDREEILDSQAHRIACSSAARKRGCASCSTKRSSCLRNSGSR